LLRPARFLLRPAPLHPFLWRRFPRLIDGKLLVESGNRRRQRCLGLQDRLDPSPFRSHVFLPRAGPILPGIRLKVVVQFLGSISSCFGICLGIKSELLVCQKPGVRGLMHCPRLSGILLRNRPPWSRSSVASVYGSAFGKMESTPPYCLLRRLSCNDGFRACFSCSWFLGSLAVPMIRPPIPSRRPTLRLADPFRRLHHHRRLRHPHLTRNRQSPLVPNRQSPLGSKKGYRTFLSSSGSVFPNNRKTPPRFLPQVHEARASVKQNFGGSSLWLCVRVFSQAQ
jgi:hypothetical protein